MATTAYDYVGYFNKAKLFVNRSFEQIRSPDEAALWASLALELLGKAALARNSPLLVAEPTEDGNNLLIAVGLVDEESRFLTVRASTVFKRCGRAFRPFNSVEALLIAAERNEYLHGAGAGFGAVPEQVWWGRFWAQAVILLEALDKDVEALVGPDRVATVEESLARTKENTKQRVEARIARAKQRLTQRDSEHTPTRLHNELNRRPGTYVGLDASIRQACPACDEAGELHGYAHGEPELQRVEIGDDDFDVIAFQTYVSEVFTCANCLLTLDDAALVAQAGIPEAFALESDASDLYDVEYGND